ncbi:MAG: hypothetical protein HXY52_05405 [Nitrospirae bacterium]|nr:hypothetical protein [Nitrospirota bacterium]
MKANKCISCDNKTLQKDGICVSCKTGIRQMYKELIDLMQKQRNHNSMKRTRSR